jgi:DNA polymerase III alpha subunit
MFIHLRAHSNYSFLTGIPSPVQLAQTAASYTMPALGMTDRDMLTGSVEFYEACLDIGIHPIIGLELPVAAPHRLQSAPKNNLETLSRPLALLAMDLSGWRSLCRLSSALLSDPEQPTPNHLPFESIAQEANG